MISGGQSRSLLRPLTTPEARSYVLVGMQIRTGKIMGSILAIRLSALLLAQTGRDHLRCRRLQHQFPLIHWSINASNLLIGKRLIARLAQW